MNRKLCIVLAFVTIGMILCSGCISSDNGTKTPATTVPANVDATPVSASGAQATLEAREAAYEAAPAKVQEYCEALEALLQAPDMDYEELYQMFENYEEALIEYNHALTSYYSISILLEHTTPIEGDLLELRKDTLPFDRPDGDMLSHGELELWAESFYYSTNLEIRPLIEEGIDGHDTRQGIIDALAGLEEYLPEYYDKEIGYIYYSLNDELLQQSLYSDVLIYDCNPYCISIP